MLQSVLPALVVAAVLALLGRVTAALVVLVLGGLLGQAVALSPAVARRVERGVVAVGRAVGVTLGAVLFGLLFVVVLVPVGLVRRLRPGRRPLAEPGWDGIAEPAPARPFERRPPEPRGIVLPLLGTLAVVVVLDLALGAVLTVTGVVPGPDEGDLAHQRERIDEIVSSPAMADAEWADDYGDELLDVGARSAPRYVPYLVWGHEPFDGRFINVDDRERASYVPDLPPGEEPLRVALFGGSTMFGEGQRDEHTIASELARVAEAQGVLLEVHNYGVGGWVAWQEYLYLERLLADGEQYDLVVFYDGINEANVQYTDYSPEPTHNGAAVLQEYGAERNAETSSEPGLFDGAAAVVDSWQRYSGTLGLWGHLRGDEPTTTFSLAPEDRDVSVEQREATAVDVYSRAVRRIDDLAADADTPVVFVWQPRKQGWSDEVLAALPEQVVDLSGAFDGTDEPIYLDSSHTNERGARLVAEALWAQVGPSLEAQAAAG